MAARARYFANAIKLNGVAVEVVPNSNVTLYEAGTLTPVSGATIFAGPTGATTRGNPFTTDAQGNILFYLDAARRVKLVCTGVSVGPLTADYEPVLPDPVDLVTQSMPRPLKLDGYAGVDDFALTIRPTTGGSEGNKALMIKDDVGNTMLEVGPRAYGLADTAVYMQKLAIGFRNWGAGWDFLCVIQRMTGNPTGSHVPATFNYNTVAQPSDGVGGSVNVPDDVAISCVVFADNVAGGGSQTYDGGIRTSEFQQVMKAGTSLTRGSQAIEIGNHTANNKASKWDGAAVSALFGDNGIFLHSDDLTGIYPGMGTGTRANVAIIVGGNANWKQFHVYMDTFGNLMHQVDQSGHQISGDLYPRSGGNIVGSPSNRWAQVWANFVTAVGGSVANPGLALGAAGTEGFASIGGGLSMMSGTTQRLRLDANGNILIGTAPLSPAATDGFFYLESCAGVPGGTPASPHAGGVPMIYDSTNNRLYCYNGGWKGVVLA